MLRSGVATTEARRTNADAGREHVVAKLVSKSTAEWLDILTEAGVPVQAVRGLPEVVADEQWRHRGVMVQADGIAGLDEAATLIGAPFVADTDGPDRTATAPGQVGQHTREVLEQFGCSEDEIAAVLGAE